MKEQIIEIINKEHEGAELKTARLIILFNQHIINTLKSCEHYAVSEFVDKVFIKL